MKLKKIDVGLSWSSNLLILYAAVIGGITLYQRIEAWHLGGACPVPLQRPYTFSAIGAALLALVLMYLSDRVKKRASG